MKGIRIAVLGLALVLGSTVAGAQGGRGGGRGGNMAMAGIDSTLSADQRAKMNEITRDAPAEPQPLPAPGGPDRPEQIKKSPDVTAKVAPETRKILSAEQQ